ncbi:MAG: hypothetical protein II546_02900, partial [Prevotella sp.]|nr:hypothetical protein [Prevotella sp.]
MENPIKYSDLIVADDSITKLIAQLKELMVTYNGTAEDIKKQATELAAKLREVNGATEQGRQSIKGGASDAEKLAKAYEKNAFAQSETAKELARVNEETRQLNNINKLAAKAEIDMSKAAADVTKNVNLQTASYNKLSATYSLMKIRLNAMEQAGKGASEEYKRLAASAKQIYERMDELQRATGKFTLNVGNYEQSILNAIGANNVFARSIVELGKGGEEASKAMVQISSATKAFGQNLTALLANPAFLGLAGVAGAVGAFKWFYDYNNGIKEATKLTMEFTGMGVQDAKQFRDEIQGVADVFNQEFKPTLQAVDALAANFGIGWGEALQVVKDGFVAGADLNGDFLSKLQRYPQYFNEAGLSASQFVAILTQTRSGIFTDKGLEAIKMANTRIRELSDQTKEALDNIGISSKQVEQDLQSGARNTFDIVQEVAAKLSELPDSAQVVGETLKEVFGKKGADAGLALVRSLKDINTNLDEVKSQTGELGKLNEQLVTSATELDKAISSLFDSTGGAFERMTTKAKIFFNDVLVVLIKALNIMSVMFSLIGKKNQDEILGSLAKIKDVWEGNTEAVQEYNAAVSGGTGGTTTTTGTGGSGGTGGKGGTDKAAEEAARKRAEALQYIADKEKEREQSRLAFLQQFIQLRLQTVEKGSSDEYALLMHQLELKKQIDMASAQNDYDVLAAMDRYNQEKLNIEKKYYDSREKAAIQSMNKLKAIIDKENQERGEKEVERNEAFKQSMSDAYQFAIGQVQAYMDKRVEMAQQQVEQANTEVQVAQQALTAEIEAKNAGYASNVEMARKELAMAKENQKKALDEQAKAQKQQLAMQTITQAADLVSASAKIWAQLGFPWAIPAIAVMWGSFAAAKIKALSMTKGSTEKYGEGTVELLDGGSHQSGNDIDLGRKKDGTRRRAEGGEYFAIINKRSSRKYGRMIPDIVNALNAGTFTEKYMHAFPSADAIAVNVAGGGTD